ncbi:MAG: gliding motility-associated C-terminal domain-containing protein [Bacteroidota bacterium]
MLKYYSLVILVLFLLLPQLSIGQTQYFAPPSFPVQESQATEQHPRGSGIRFIPNQGQWEGDFAYLTELGGLNYLYFSGNKLTYLFYDQEKSQEVHDVMQLSEAARHAHQVPGHAFSVNFTGASLPVLSGQIPQKVRHNYLLGNDPTKWASNVPVYQRINYQDLYPGIDLTAYSQHGQFKYDFIIAPHADPGQIRLDYEGVDSLRLVNHDLIVYTSVLTLRELAPVAYQIINGQRTKVPCAYHLVGNELSFTFPAGYRRDLPLVIDPVVIGATLSGTINNQNFGHSATFDQSGNIYTAAISFGQGYPATVGAFSRNFAGGLTDMAVNKYNEDGTDMIYATYIGGIQNDYPLSTIVDFNGQLCIYGSSNSPDFPTTATAVQPSHGGDYDIVVTRLSENGDALVGSTYLGGTRDDGRNGVSNVNFLEGDQYRGEIVLDPQGNIYVASCSQSTNFPATDNAFQPFRGGINGNDQDGVVLKLNSDVSTIFWASYLGSSDDDMAFGLRVDDNGDVYTTGFFGDSYNLMPAGGLVPNYPGGRQSAFVVKIKGDGTTILRGTYYGTPEEDKSYFMDIDEGDQVHIYGRTTGFIEVTPGTFSSFPGSEQFLAAFDADLSELVYSTVIGSALSSDGVFIPVAFMVDKCNNIYFSGYRSSDGLPISEDAFYTIGESFYLGVLEPNATGLSFGTYYGEANHVDGGTSRFDKAGIVYQGVCSCAWSDRVMNTTPGAWATSQTTDCDVGVFKIDFEIETVTAAARVSPATSGCAPYTTQLFYTGQDAETIFWDFGNGQTSSDFNPTATFSEPGMYTITQIVNANNTCNLSDTFQVQIDVLDQESTLTEQLFCPGTVDLFLDVSTSNATYEWQDGTIGPTYQTGDPGIYWVDINLVGCSRRDSFIVTAETVANLELGPDFTVCDQGSVQLDATTDSVVSYFWRDGSTDPILNITETGQYFVTVTDINGCEVEDDISIRLSETPTIELGPNLTPCTNEAPTFTIPEGIGEVNWSTGVTTNQITPTASGQYFVSVTQGGCTAVDSVTVDFIPSPAIIFTPIDVTCFGDGDGSIVSTNTDGQDNLSYAWEGGFTTTDRTDLPPGDYPITITNAFNCTQEEIVTVGTNTPVEFETIITDVICARDANGALQVEISGGGIPPYLIAFDDGIMSEDTQLNGLDGGTYTIELQDANGCTFFDTVVVYEPPEIFIEAGPDQWLDLGESTTINGWLSTVQNQNYFWSPDDSISCLNCLRARVNPTATMNYFLTTIDSISGCTKTDTLQIRVARNRRVFIPNAFSPDGDGNNDMFTLFTDNSVSRIRFLRIYQRWGNLVYERENFLGNDTTKGWDGTFLGEPLNAQVLVYVAEVEFLDGSILEYKGDLTLVR